MEKLEMENEKKIPVETALEQLEELIARLESKECTLEESFHLYKGADRGGAAACDSE